MEWYCVWWPWLTSKCVVRVCQHQLSFLFKGSGELMQKGVMPLALQEHCGCQKTWIPVCIVVKGIWPVKLCTTYFKTTPGKMAIKMMSVCVCVCLCVFILPGWLSFNSRSYWGLGLSAGCQWHFQPRSQGEEILHRHRQRQNTEEGNGDDGLP